MVQFNGGMFFDPKMFSNMSFPITREKYKSLKKEAIRQIVHFYKDAGFNSGVRHRVEKLGEILLGGMVSKESTRSLEKKVFRQSDKCFKYIEKHNPMHKKIKISSKEKKKIKKTLHEVVGQMVEARNLIKSK